MSRPSSPASPARVTLHGDARLAADLRRALVDRGVGDVRKVGDQQVDLLDVIGDPLGHGHLERDAEPLRRSRALSPPPPREVGGGDAQVGPLAEQGQGDRARAGADLVHAGALRAARCRPDQQLGLAARDQHPLVDRDLDLAEAAAAEDVLERLALAAAGDVALDLRPGLGTRPVVPSRSSSSTRIESALATKSFASASGVSQPAAAIASVACARISAGARRQRRSLRLGSHGYSPATGLIGSVEATVARLPCRRRTTRIQIVPIAIIPRLSSWAVVRPRATRVLRRRNSTKKRSAPA